MGVSTCNAAGDVAGKHVITTKFPRDSISKPGCGVHSWLGTHLHEPQLIFQEPPKSLGYTMPLPDVGAHLRPSQIQVAVPDWTMKKQEGEKRCKTYCSAHPMQLRI